MTLWYDVLSIMIIFLGIMIGFNLGMVRQILSVTGLYFGLIFASYFLPSINRGATAMMGQADSLAREAALFFLVFIGVWFLISLATYFSFRQAPRFLPEVLDRMIGAALGLVTGTLAVVVITLLLSYATDVTWPQGNGLRVWMQNGIQASFLRPLFSSLLPLVANAIEPWMPRGLPRFFLSAG